MYKRGNTYSCADQILEYIISSFRLNEIPNRLREDWNLSEETYDADKMYFLQDHFIIELNDILGLPDSAISAFLQALVIVRDNPSLSRLIWHYHHMLFICKKDITGEIGRLLSMEKCMGNLSGMFSAIVILSGFLEALKLHRYLNIPLNITIDTFSDVRIWMEDYHSKHGVWGLSELSWLYTHLSGGLYRIGRLQYVYNRFSGCIKAFRNILSGEVVILSEGNLKYRRDGLLDGTNDIYDVDGVWTSLFNIDDHFVYSNCILINGNAQKMDMILSLTEWEQILSKGDYSLAIHIPTGSRLDSKECKESLAQVIQFYQTYFPEKKLFSFNCGSWLLEPQLQKIMPPSSNIVQFQKLFHIYPILGNEAPFLDRVFAYLHEDMPSDLSKLPRETLLQQAISDYLIAGNRLHPGAGVIFPDEVTEW